MKKKCCEPGCSNSGVYGVIGNYAVKEEERLYHCEQHMQQRCSRCHTVGGELVPSRPPKRPGTVMVCPSCVYTSNDYRAATDGF